MNITRFLKPAALFVTLILLSGCSVFVVPFGAGTIIKTDPLRKQAVKIVKVAGRTITLADGREIELAGLKPVSGGQDPHHARDTQADVARALIGRHVVVVPEGPGQGRLLEISMHEKPVFHGIQPLLFANPDVEYAPSDIMVSVLISFSVEKESGRCDMGGYLLELGMAEPLPEEISDPKVRAEYVANAESARKKKYGIWASVNERLTDAVRRGDLETVRLLLDKGADPNWTKGRYGSNPLIEACWKDDGLEMVLVMLEKGGDPNLKGSDNRTPLHAAAIGGNVQIIALLLKRGARIDAVTRMWKETPLHSAASAGNVRIAAILLKHGADINAVAPKYYGYDATPIMAAADSRQQEMVKFLIGKGADLKVAGGSEMVLHYFCRPGETEIVKLLVEHGANPSSVHKWNTPLHLAAECGALKTADFLISQGVDVNAKNLQKNTPLHVAVQWDKKEMVELLISKGADVNARGNGGRRPLKIARQCEHDEIVKILRAHGARE